MFHPVLLRRFKARLRSDLLDILVWEAPVAEPVYYFGCPQRQTLRQRFQGQIIYFEGKRHTNREKESEPGKGGQPKCSKLARQLLELNPSSREHPSVILPRAPGSSGICKGPPSTPWLMAAQGEGTEH